MKSVLYSYIIYLHIATVSHAAKLIGVKTDYNHSIVVSTVEDYTHWLMLVLTGL